MSVIAVAVVEFLGSALALLVSLVFLQADIGRYRMSEKSVHIYGPASAFHFLDPAFYIVFIILPMLFGLLGIVCASGLVRGRTFSPRFQSWFVCCWCFSIRARFFPRTQAREQYLLLEEASILCFLCVCSLSLSP
jgi:hypothetical protein